MKRFLLARLRALPLALGLTALVAQAAPNNSDQDLSSARNSRERRIAREEWFIKQRTYPLQQIPRDARRHALDQIQAASSPSVQNAAALLPANLWTNIGPAPILDGQVAPRQPVSGRVVAIAVDPFDFSHWLIGASHGGVWETRNAGASWRPLTDDQASLAMGAVTFAPSNPSIIYAGTGEPTFSLDSYAGEGILKSTDGGITWSLIGTNQFAKASISDIKVDPNNPNVLLAASVPGFAGREATLAPGVATLGVYKSVDGGSTWSFRLRGEATDLEINPTDFTKQYCALAGIGPYRSTDSGDTWASIAGPWSTFGFRIGRVELALAPSNPDTLYISIEDASFGDLLGVWRSDNAFSSASPTWRQINNPPNPGFQFAYDHDLLVDPSNPDRFYLAETTLWLYDGSWTAIGGDYNPQVLGRLIHPDEQALAWAGSRLIVANDGGVWSSLNRGTNWINHNNTLSISTIYDGSVHPTNANFAIAGCQDNGSERWNGSNAWHFIWYGDGCDNAISSSRPNTDWAVSSQFLSIVRTTDGGLNFIPADNGIDGFGAPFVARFEKSPANDDIFIAGTDNLWRCNNFFSSSSPFWFRNGPEMGSEITAVAFAAGDRRSDTYAFGTALGDLRLTTDGGNTWTDIDANNAVPNRAVTDMVFDSTNRNILYVTLSGFDEGTPSQPGHLFKSTNLLSNLRAWSNVTPPVNIPFNTVAVDPNDSAIVYVGTDIALWQSPDGGRTWSFIGPSLGMPNVAVFDLNVNAIAGQVTAFTHGRGAFVLQIPREVPSDLSVTATVTPNPAILSNILSYTVTITNAGPFTSAQSFLTNTLAPGLSFVSATPSRGSCSQAGGIVTCSLGALPSAGSASVTIRAQANTLGFITNTAVVAGASLDPNPANNTNLLVSVVRSPLPVIQPVNAHLISESLAPANGAIDSNETVSISFALQNVGAGTASNLVATLLPFSGVSSPSGPVSYGQIQPNDIVSRTFTFTASSTNGEVTTSFQLQDGPNNLGEIAFTFGLRAVVGFSNPTVITVPTVGPALIYPSTIFVSGVPGVLSKATVTLSNLNHTFVQDLDILLVAPNGQSVLLMSDAGGPNTVSGVTLTFDDAAIDPLSQFTAPASGAYKPTDFDGGDGDQFPAPAPSGPFDTTLASLIAGNPNGEWSLFVYDDTDGDSGRISGGWRLDLQTIDPVDPSADLIVSTTASPNPVLAGTNLTYTISLHNRGPDTATSVVLTNQLSPFTAFVSVDTTQGSCDQSGGIVSCQLGDLPVDGEIQVTITAHALRAGTATNNVNIRGAQSDLNLLDNSNRILSPIAPAADLQLLLSADSNPTVVGRNLTLTLVVTNSGPNQASGIRVTNYLPAGATYISSSSPGSLNQSGNFVTWSVSPLNASGSASLSLVVRPTATGSITNSANVASSQTPDLTSDNNSAAAIITVVDRPVSIVPGSVVLLSESYSPPSGGIEPGEQVTLNLGLRNVGVSNATALLATLRNTSGVASSNAPQNYGAVVAQGSEVAKPFTFVASGTVGSTINVILDLTDGGDTLGSVTFSFALGGTSTFAGNGSLIIRDNHTADRYPWSINVSGLAGVVSKATVTLNHLSHDYPADIDVLLVSPDQRGAIIFSDVGGSTPIQDIFVTLDDAASSDVPRFGPILPGIYRPTNLGASEEGGEDDNFPPPAPQGDFGDQLSVFNGANPNGTWSLFVVDDFQSDSGQLGGWTLNFTTVGRISSRPHLSGVTVTNGFCQFKVEFQPGDAVVVESSSDFTNWTPLDSNTNSLDPSSPWLFRDSNPALDRSFYRARLLSSSVTAPPPSGKKRGSKR